MADMWQGRQVSLSVQIRDGAVRYLRGLPLPRLYERVVGDLVVPAGAVVGKHRAREPKLAEVGQVAVWQPAFRVSGSDWDLGRRTPGRTNIWNLR